MIDQEVTAISLSLTPFAELVDKDVVDLIFQLAPKKIVSRVAKALDHYTKAQRLVGVDDEMGAIRCIAAEEELVVAIFEWLKLNADKVPEHRDFIYRHKNHRVKLAFYPVLSQLRFAIGDMLTDGLTMPGLEGYLHLQATAIRVGDQVKLQIRDQDGKDLINFNPLDIAITQGDRELGEVLEALYRDLERTIADQRGMTVRQFITERAEYRNKLMYAEDAGYLSMKETLEYLIRECFTVIIRDLLWCLAILLSDKPLVPHWGLISQFISLYRRVMTEAKVI